MTLTDKIAEFRIDLLKMSNEDVFDKYFFQQNAYLFEHVLKRVELEEIIASIIGNALDTSVDNIHLMGSSKLGFSISPLKLFRPLDYEFGRSGLLRDKSDLDIAIVSAELFNRIGREVYGYTSSYKHKWKYNDYYPLPKPGSVDLCYKFFEYFTKGWFRMDFKPKGYDVCVNTWNYQKLKKAVLDVSGRKVTLAIYSDDFYFRSYHLENLSTLSLRTKINL